MSTLQAELRTFDEEFPTEWSQKFSAGIVTVTTSELAQIVEIEGGRKPAKYCHACQVGLPADADRCPKCGCGSFETPGRLGMTVLAELAAGAMMTDPRETPRAARRNRNGGKFR